MNAFGMYEVLTIKTKEARKYYFGSSVVNSLRSWLDAPGSFVLLIHFYAITFFGFNSSKRIVPVSLMRSFKIGHIWLAMRVFLLIIRFYFTHSNSISNSTLPIVHRTKAPRALVSHLESFYNMFFIFLSLFQSLKQTEWRRSLVLFQKNNKNYKNTWRCFKKKKVLYFVFIQRLKQTKRQRSFVLF